MARSGLPAAPGRANMRRRTRKQLLEATGRLLRAGRTPSIEEIAAEALVSRATVYRYFPNVEALLAEAPVDEAVPEGPAFFADDQSTEPVARLDRAEAMLHAVCYQHAAALRAMLAASLQRAGLPQPSHVPRRQNRRTSLIAAALAPSRSELSRASYQRLCAALALVFGTESMIVFDDILGLDAEAARDVKRWMIAALVAHAQRA